MLVTRVDRGMPGEGKFVRKGAQRLVMGRLELQEVPWALWSVKRLLQEWLRQGHESVLVIHDHWR